MTVQEIKKIISENEDTEFGLRCDEYKYNVNDTCENSHQLFQDAFYDENDELVYPEGEGIYEGYYDAGELDGTSAIRVTEENVEEVIEMLKSEYACKYINLIGGETSEEGNDIDEIIINNAKVFITERM